MKPAALFFLILLVSVKLAAGQGLDTSKQKQVADISKIQQTSNQSSITYQTLSQFFQSSVTTGANGGFDFKTSWFALQELFKGSQMELSQYYTSKKFQRNFQVSLGIHKNTAGELSTLTGGVTYSPINKRSKSDNNFLMAGPQLLKAIQAKVAVFKEADSIYKKKYISSISDHRKQDVALKAYNNATKKYNTSQDDSDLPAAFKTIRDSIIKAQIKAQKLSLAVTQSDIDSFLKAPQNTYDQTAKKIDMGSLLTLSFNPGYDYNHKSFDTTSFKITYLKGFGPANKPFNLDLSAEGVLLRDTLPGTANLSRHEFIGKMGVSKTLVNDDQSNPLVEFETQLEDDNYFNSPLYKNEEKNTFTFNAVLTVHLSQQLALPVTLKYDLKKPNLFGIFNLTWNFQSTKTTSPQADQ